MSRPSLGVALGSRRAPKEAHAEPPASDTDSVASQGACANEEAPQAEVRLADKGVACEADNTARRTHGAGARTDNEALARSYHYLIC